MKTIISGLHWFITIILVCIAFLSYNKMRNLETEFGYLCEIQRTIIMNILVEEELKIEEDSHSHGMPRTSSHPFSTTPIKLELSSCRDLPVQ